MTTNLKAILHRLVQFCVLPAILLLPQHLEACVTVYMDAWADAEEEEVYGWAFIEDYYSGGSCYYDAYGTWGTYWEHSYTADVEIVSPTEVTSYAYDSRTDVPYGGSFADALGIMSTEGGPGIYTVPAAVTIYCTIGALFVQEETEEEEEVAPTISATDDTIWHFNGLSPSGYPVSVTLTSSGGGGTTWTVTAGASLVNISATSGAQTIVTSSGSAFSTSVGDISITATANGATSDPASLTSRTPTSTVYVGPSTDCHATWGYVSGIYHRIFDNLSDWLPSIVPVNEVFTTSAIADYTGNDWVQSVPMGGVSQDPSYLVDIVGGEYDYRTPTPICQGGVEVHHWGQEWRTGSSQLGSGKLLLTNTLQKYTGHAAHVGYSNP